MAGADVIFDKESNKWRRISWTILLIVCITLLAAQVVERVRHFMKEPISVEVKVHRNNTLKFPAVTICNKNWFNLTRARRLLDAVFPGNNCSDEDVLRDDINAGNGCTVSDAIGRRLIGGEGALLDAGGEGALLDTGGEGALLDAGGEGALLDAAAVWRLTSHNFSVLVQECYFGRNVGCQRAGEWTEIVTEMGICQTYRTNEPVKTSGHFNHLYLVLNDKQKKVKKEEGFRVLIHDPGDDPRLMIRTHGSSIIQRHGRDVRMVLKEFKAIPSREYFCREGDDGYSHIGCEAHCFNTILYQEAGCLLPFMTHTPGLSGAAICNTAEHYRNAIWHKQNMLHSGGWNAQDNCTCERKCHEFEFLLFAETGEISDSRARLRVFYQDLYYENVQESLAYPVIPLLCDLGGALGLMLGASLLTFFEIVEAVGLHAFRLYRCRSQQNSAGGGGDGETVAPSFSSHFRHSRRSACSRRSRSALPSTGSALDTDLLGGCHDLEQLGVAPCGHQELLQVPRHTDETSVFR